MQDGCHNYHTPSISLAARLGSEFVRALLQYFITTPLWNIVETFARK